MTTATKSKKTTVAALTTQLVSVAETKRVDQIGRAIAIGQVAATQEVAVIEYWMDRFGRRS